MISLRTVDGMFVVATEDGMIDTTKGASRDVFWQSLLLGENETKGSTICLRSAYGKFLCVEPVGTVLADRFVNSTWETFDVLPHPTGGGVALRSFHGNFLGLDPNNGSLAISSDPVAWDGDSIDLMCNKSNATPLHVKILRKHQTLAFSTSLQKRFERLDHAKFTIVEACQALMQLNGESTQVRESRILARLISDAETLRRQGHPDWIQLIAFLRGLGMLFLLWTEDDAMVLRGISFEQWMDQTSTWVLGRPIPESVGYAGLNQTKDSTRQYEMQGGMAQAVMPWTPDEYLYRVLQGNDTSLPTEAIDIVRFQSCHPWYLHDEYADMAGVDDLDTKELLFELHSDRKVPTAEALANVAVEDLLPHYLDLSAKYLPQVMQCMALRSAVNGFAVALRSKVGPRFVVREMSVFSTIKDGISERLEARKNDKQAKAYIDQVNYLATNQTYSLHDHYLQMKKQAEEGGVTGWKSMVPGVSSMPQIQQMKAFLQIMEGLDQEHRDHPELINGKVKRVLSEKIGQPLEEINNMLRSYEQLTALRMWLRKRVERGLPLPESLEDTTEMIRQDPTGFPTKNLRPKRRR
ncbi:unnamed protein product [Aphanomyces euteiches]